MFLFSSFLAIFGPEGLNCMLQDYLYDFSLIVCFKAIIVCLKAIV
jgi:hypothetical protein